MKLKAMVFDVDGVLTDGRVTYAGNGEWSRIFCIRDGLGMIKLREAGLIVGIITASNAEDVRERAKRLKVDYFYQGSRDKTKNWDDFLEKTGLKAEEVGYMGDDDMDIPLMEACGWAVTVPGAQPYNKQIATYITQAEGGKGAVREVCEMILAGNLKGPA